MESQTNHGKKRPMLENDTNPKRKKTQDVNQQSGHWSQGLKQALKDPKNIVYESKNCSVINDKYPKAKKHFLVIAKCDLSSMTVLNQNHVSLLEEMVKIGEELQTKAKRNNPNMNFKMGFHAVPSMTRLHMHVISTDFDSPCLKNKRHWNSFTTSFFRSASQILDELKTNGCISIDSGNYKQFLEGALKCHICNERPKNIPRLKDHIRTHFQ